MPSNPSLPAETSVGPVRLTVGDLNGLKGFYEETLGLGAMNEENGVVRLGAGGTPIVELASDPGAPPRPAHTSGLFHLAVLVPSRADLARALHRLADAGARLTGASDHLVSEALYLDDPEGNGIEIYRDRPREEWPRRDGQIQMATLPLDLDSVLGEMRPGDEGGAPEGTRIGHVHLNVSDLRASEDFYSGLLGFDVTVRGYPGALFVSAGGYHHHLGLNTWAGAGAPAPPDGSRGLRRFEISVPGEADLDQVRSRLEEAGVDYAQEDGAIELEDPSGNGVRMVSKA